MPSAYGTSRLRERSSNIAAFAGSTPWELQELVVGLRQRLWFELGRDDVEHVLEMGVDVEAAHHRVGMGARAVGEDQLAARQSLDRGAERRVRLQRRVVDLVHVVEEIVRLHPVLGHHPAHRGAVALVIILLLAEGFVVADLEEIRDVVADALIDLLPQVHVMRIERVVEIEHPGLDMAEGARGGARAVRVMGGVHTGLDGSRLRMCIHPKPHRRALSAGHVDHRETACGEPLRGAVLLLADLESHFAGAQLRRPAPGEHLVAAFDPLAFLVDRLGEAVQPRGLRRQLRLDALAGIDAIPAARRHRALVVDADRRHHGDRRLVAPREADAVRLLHGIEQHLEEGRAVRGIGRQLAILQELVERGGGLLALEPVDRVGVIAGDHQQPLHAGEPRLRGIVVRFLAEIGGQVLLGLGRLDLGEAHQPLAGAAGTSWRPR